jgi:tetratricopeptide (TPR) repeat protein
VGKIIRELKGDPDLTITNFTISGYASPEGNYDKNMQLSQRRAETFALYMEKEYGYNHDQFKVQWFGEDWKGLRNAVVASNLANKNAIVEIIDNVSNHDARDARLIALDNRQTYNVLLNDFYPPLRRNDYEVSFVSRPFNVNEAKEVIKTRPKLLSLNEMFLVAQTYDPASKEFKEVFDIAARLYPDEPIAILNSAAADIEGGNNQAAIDRLSRIENDPRAWNNLGVAYVRTGEVAKAKDCFEKAAARGDEDAKHNLEELEKAMED